MKENKTFNSMVNMNLATSIEQIKKDFFKSFNIVRAFIPQEEYWILLFLLSIHKDNLSGRYLNIELNVLTILEKKDLILVDKYDQIFKILEPVLKRLSKETIGQLLDLFNSFDSVTLNEEYSVLFEELLQEINLNQVRITETNSQTSELTIFMSELSQIKDANRIYNPFSGFSSFAIDITEKQNYIGQEINHRTWGIGQLRLLANSKKENVQISCVDVTENWPEAEKFDLIISNPPFNSLRDRDIKGKFIHKYSSAEQLILDRGVDLLNPTGKIMLVVPFGFLSSKGGNEHILHNLIEQDLIDTIVNFPSGLLLNTGIKISIILINKSKENPNQIKFIDASLFVNDKNKFQKTFRANDLLDAIKHSDARVTKIISKKTILENGNDLNYQRYFTNLNDFRSVKNSKLISLKEILTSIYKLRVNPANGKVIKIGDLSNDKFNYHIDIDLLNAAEIDKSYYQINQPALLIAKTFNRLKPSYYETTDNNSVFVSQNIEAFTISSNEIELPYLIMQLNSDFVQKQLELNSNGAVYPNLKISDILNLKIEIPNLDIQDSKIRQIALIEGSKLQSDKNAIEKLQLQNTIDKLVQERVNDYQWILHDLRNGELFTVKNQVLTLEIFAQMQEETLKKIKIESLDISLYDYVNKLSLETTKLSNAIDELYDISSSNEEKIEKIEIISFIKAYVNQILIDNNNFKVDLTSLDEFQLYNNISELIITGNSAHLKNRILKNIFENAFRHGNFSNSLKENLIKIVINLSEDKQMLSLAILNTGKKSQITSLDYFSNGGKAGSYKNSGKGGYIIKTYAEKNNWVVQQNSYDETENWKYTFGIEIHFKIFNNEEIQDTID